MRNTYIFIKSSILNVSRKYLLNMANCECTKISGLDLETPRNVNLTAFYKRSFAHHTVKERLPVIVTHLIDGLVRNKEEIANIYTKEALDDLKIVIGELSKLKYEIQTNKNLSDIKSKTEEAQFYNNYLKEQFDKNSSCHFFECDFLLAECYVYRKIKDIFDETILLQEYDPFRIQKQDAFNNALPLINSIGEHLLSILNVESNSRNSKDDFVQILKLNLWGNKCDLSLSNGKELQVSENISTIEKFNANILVDHSELIWTTLNEHSRGEVVDIVLDNSGYEVFTDFCLADFLVTNNLANKVRFYVKTIPWYISDVMNFDFHWVIEQLSNSENEVLSQLGKKWTEYVSLEIWTIEEHTFWTLPIDFSNMMKIDEELYRKLQRPKLIIFKGDLNYRKLFGDINWDPTESVETALRGFNPSKLCTLRTLKCDIICGLPTGLAEETEAIDKDWLITGNYGVIQFCEKVTKIPLVSVPETY